MPAKKEQPGKRPLRSGNHRTISDDDEPSDAVAVEREETQAEANVETSSSSVPEPLSKDSLPTATDINDDDGDTVMQEQAEAAEAPSNPGPSQTQPSQEPRRTTTERAPVERLTSILPSSSSRPSTLKFKPKPVLRRTKEEREATERAERERLAALEAAERGPSRGGGRGGRGFGPYGTKSGSGRYGGSRGEASFLRREGTNQGRVASGPLGGPGLVEKKKRRKGRSADVLEDDEDGDGDDEARDEANSGGAQTKGKGKGKEQVKTEGDARGGDGDASVKTAGGKPKKGEKRKRTSGVAASGGKGKGRTKVKEEDEFPTYISSEGEFDSDAAAKINIEAINLVSSDEKDTDEDEGSPFVSEIARGKQKELSKSVDGKKVKSWMNRPVHVERQEHVERAMGVNTDASSLLSAELRRKAKERKDREGGLFVDEISEINQRPRRGKRKSKDVEFVRDERKWKGVYVDDDDENEDGNTKVKSEPEEETAAVDALRVLEKADEVPGAEAMEVDDVDVDAAVEEVDAANGFRAGDPGAKTLDKDTHVAEEVSSDEEEVADEDGSLGELAWVTQDADDILTDFDDEDDNEDADLELLDESEEGTQSAFFSKHQQEWSTLLKQFKSKSGDLATATNSEPPSKVTFTSNKENVAATRQGKTYLIQIPPLIPSLRDIFSKSVSVKMEKKPQTSDPASAPFDRSSVPSSKDVVKDGSPPPPTEPGSQKISNAIHQPALPSHFTGGTAGSLTFYNSGQTVATWGGLSFEVSQEKEVVGLAQESIMMEYEKVVTKVEEQDRWEDVISVGGHAGEGGSKVGYSGGKVGGGFCMLGA